MITDTLELTANRRALVRVEDPDATAETLIPPAERDAHAAMHAVCMARADVEAKREELRKAERHFVDCNDAFARAARGV